MRWATRLSYAFSLIGLILITTLPHYGKLRCVRLSARFSACASSAQWVLQYDTIRDAILTCARKPTWVSLIYRTETTTKNCKTEKLESKNRYARSNSKKAGESCSQSWRRKRKAAEGGKDLQKRKVLGLEWKREWVMKNNNKCNC